MKRSIGEVMGFMPSDRDDVRNVRAMNKMSLDDEHVCQGYGKIQHVDEANYWVKTQDVVGVKVPKQCNAEPNIELVEGDLVKLRFTREERPLVREHPSWGNLSLLTGSICSFLFAGPRRNTGD